MLHESADAPLPGSPRVARDVKHVILVATRFAQFADGDRVLTVPDLVAARSARRAPAAGREWVIHFGQGVDRSDLQPLLTHGHDVRLAASAAVAVPLVSPATVHKQRSENVLLAGLRHPAGTRCSADLRIHRDNELVLDHHSRQHVPGMVIIEAVRQICTAQFETTYRADLPTYDYAGVWHRVDVRFDSFLFALPAEVSSDITAVDLGRKHSPRFRAVASVRQNGGVVATAEIEYSMIERRRIDLVENRRSRQAAEAMLAGVER
ncbi:AfsA-related hotdog domain-containing protein [Micromonospora rifamycinica]|uniref:AfsA-related hotdog domain-containing protein n=1 Tax=Micromonospora rifamycinica TaxID=291594 RepID=UPI0033D1C885